MRGYFLTNMYLSPIQRGIQSAHCLHDMFVTYRPHSEQPAADLLWKWAEHEKTMIVLNGGTSEELEEFFDFLMKHEEDYPFEKFQEPGIGNAITCVGIILSDRMVELVKHYRDNESGDLSHLPLYSHSTELVIAKRIASLPLA